MIDWLVSILLVAGASLRLLAAVGLLRFPDVLTRLHAAAKAGALGLVLIIVAVATHFQGIGTALRALLILVFVLVTAPVAAQAIARCAYLTGCCRLPEGRDELACRSEGLM